MVKLSRMHLKGKIVLITGSSMGIGREDAYKFAQEGCKLIITYNKHKKEGEEVARECKKLGAEDVLLVELDVSDGKSIKNAVKRVVDKFGETSILINNAGVVVWKHLENQSMTEIESQVRINLEGLIKMTQECLPYITDMIINISSGAGMHGYPQLTTYCATKWGVRGFTKALTEELHKIKVYVVNPGTTATQMNDFEGMEPEKVAQVILNLAKGKYKLESGSDVNIWDYVKE